MKQINAYAHFLKKKNEIKGEKREWLPMQSGEAATMLG